MLLPVDALEICGHGHRKKKLTCHVTVAISACNVTVAISSSSRSSWGEGPSSSSTPFWVPDSSTLGEDCRGPTLCLKRWGGSPEWEKGALEAMADVVKGPLSMVLQDGSEVVFLENASSEEETPSNKELSSFKDFSRFLGMSVEGYEEKIVLLLKKLKKMIGGGTLCKKRKKKAVSASRSERDLKRLDCMISYGELVLANRRSGRNKWELILVD